MNTTQNTLNPHFSFSQSKRIGTLTFDKKGAKINTLSQSVLDELSARLDTLADSKELDLLIIRSGKPNSFIAGADIEEFLKLQDLSAAVELSERGQRTFDKLAHLPFPTLAVIEGPCLGGGLELALACKYRLVVDTEQTQLGLPEVNLGIIPGWGGTQRLPQVVGLEQGLQMILSGKPVDARRAMKMGLATAIASPSFLEEELLKLAGKIQLGEGLNHYQASLRNKLLEGTSLGRALIYRLSEKKIREKTGGDYPAPLTALELIQKSYKKPKFPGFRAEAEAIASLFHSPVAKQLINLFFAQQKIKKYEGTGKVLPIDKTGVVGAGTMGGGISWLFSQAGHPVLLKDLDWSALTRGLQGAQAAYDEQVARKKIKKEQATVNMHRIQGVVDYRGFEGCDLVVEAVFEDLREKRRLIKGIEQNVSDSALIASNTSSLSIAALAEEMAHPERFLGLHFFNPVNRMPLVEVVAGPKTSPDAVATAFSFMRSLGKTPIVVKDCPGFLVNRLLLSNLNEAVWLLTERANFEKVDQAMQAFGMPMGPFRLLDEVGIDIAYKAACSLQEAYSGRMELPTILKEIIAAGFLGKKSGRGFYQTVGKKAVPNPEMVAFISRHVPPAKEFDPNIIRMRLLFPMINEAARCLEEKVVSSPTVVDMGLILGTGFPPFRGGLLRYADELGILSIVDQLEIFSREISPRFAPSGALLNTLEKGKFYE